MLEAGSTGSPGTTGEKEAGRKQIEESCAARKN
jgi:hypothetical protein